MAEGVEFGSIISSIITFKVLVPLLFGIGIFYTYYLHIAPFAYNFKSSIIFLIALFIPLMGISLLEYIIVNYKDFLEVSESYKNVTGKDVKFSIALSHPFIINLILAICGSAMSMISIATKEEEQKDQLETQNLKSELALLRSQINPHFLFNSLNNIYTLVYKKRDEAPNALMKLSDILRYMLYECTEDKADLEHEVKYQRDYLDLQRLRYSEEKKINLEITGDTEGKQIAPMLFIPFLENAFKHGAKDGEIAVKIHIENDNLNFSIKNQLPTKKVSKDQLKGLGIQNVERRLELLYPGKYNLKKQIENTYFVVELKLELA